MTVKYRMIIFDFDGTLAETFPFMVSVLDQLADRHHLQRLDKSLIPTLRGYKIPKLIKMFNIPIWKLPSMATDLQEMMHQNIDSIKLFPGMEKLIKDLHEQQITLAIVTSNAMRNVQKVLGEEIMKCISYIECGVPLMSKAGVLRRLLRTSSILPHEALAIGDETRDIEAARKLGISSLAVNWGFSTQPALEDARPDFLVSSAEQILEIACL